MSAHKQQYFLFVQIGSSNPLPLPVEAPASGVVVESGPVVYDDVPGDEEEDEEDETCVSALEMLGSNGGFNLSAIFWLRCVTEATAYCINNLFNIQK